MKFRVKKKGLQIWIGVHLSKEEMVDERELMRLCALGENSLFRIKREKNTLFYFGPTGVSLEERLRKPIGKYDFFIIMEQIAHIVNEVEKKMSLSQLVLDEKYIFINEMTKEMQFLYLPISGWKSSEQADKLVERILYSVRKKAEDDSEYISDFAFFYKGLKGYQAKIVEQYIQDKEPKIVETICGNINMNETEKDRLSVSTLEYDMGDDSSYTRLLTEEEQDWLFDSESMTVVNSEDNPSEDDFEDGTRLLTNQEIYGESPTLIRSKTGEAIKIDKPRFRIGRSIDESDYCLDGNKRVGRKHAEILIHNDTLYVVDLNSLNHTYLNGKLLDPGKEFPVANGDELILADEKFVVIS